MREMSDQILKKYPTASIFTWHVLDHDGFKALKPPRVYISEMYSVDGQRIDEESFDSESNRIVAQYEERLEWTQREEGLQHAYSVTEARDVTDENFEAHPGFS
jgi:hypothetical protein